MSYSDTYDPQDGIAIVGMAGRFPGARTPRELWRNLLLGRETITHFPPEELEPAGADEMALRLDPAYVRARGILEDVDRFDAAFFGFTPKEAEVLDPQQRLFLEAAWEALEDAGYDPKSFSGPIGVFAGSSNNSYFPNNLLNRKDVTENVGWLTTMMGNEKDYLATRVAYKLDLKGPALNIVTACSTSLVAVCQAVQSLATFQCDLALAGGVSVTLPQRRGYLSQEGAITSPDGHCRAFDQRAAGTVFSNGLGIVVLRRLVDAVAAGDTICAVIKGAALNNDGNAKVSFTAPSVEGHTQVIAMAQALAGIDPDTITYVEAHGTGTSLGDPIEIAGLTQAFRAGGALRSRTCALGALKTNIGHLDAAAGVAGLIKTALALHHRTLPATLHFEAPNPKLDLGNTPFFVNAQCRPWEAGGQPLRAGVSSFGVGGTNAHVVLEEAPAAELPQPGRRSHLVVLSARTPAALDEQCQRLAARLSDEADIDLADAAYTLQTGRRAFEYRFAFACKDRDGALEALNRRRQQPAPPRPANGCDGVAFLFPGQGAQHVGMGRDLYDSEPLFRREVDECCKLLAPLLGRDLREVLYPAAENVESATIELTQTSVTQPALFVIEYALARLLMSWGVHPAAMIGHSLGEYVAATIGGTFERDDALVLLARRAALMQALPAGKMLAVKAPPERVAGHLTGALSIAAYNSPSLVLVSGESAAIDTLAKELTGQSIACRTLPTSHAFHSAMMEPILGEFKELVQVARPQPPRQAWISCLTGAPVTATEACDPDYWARQLRQPVRFSEGIRQLLDLPLALLEIGPGQTLATLARQHGTRKSAQPVIAVLPAKRSATGELDATLHAIGQLWMSGCAIDWNAFNEGHRRRRISLPTYPFERTRHWVEPPRQESEHLTASAPVAPVTSSAAHTNGHSNGHIVQQRVEVSHAMTANETLRDSLRQLFADLSGLESSSLDPETSFFELGLDSLVLTQAAGALHKRFGVHIKFRELLEDCSTLTALANRVAQLAPQLASGPVAASIVRDNHQGSPATGTGAIRNPLAVPSSAGSADLAQLLTQNMQLMASQLELMQQCVAGLSAQNGVGQPPATPAPAAAPAPVQPPARAVGTPAAPSTPPTQGFGPYRPPAKSVKGALTTEQQRHLDSFIERYCQRTRKSKELTALHRSHLADPRSVAGFRPTWKEIVYPIVTERSEGSGLWDIDGNQYVDLVNGFGSILFGHNPEFIRSALKAQLDAGIEIGPQSPIAGKVAALICEMVGMQRAAFCNTGSEAVTAAIRTARTVTGRDKIVMFAGAYHGIFDEVLVRPRTRGSVPGAQPIAPGIPATMAENVIVLDYGDAAALDVIRAQGEELAAVLVEPVQSRRPDLQAREFVQELRQITTRSNTALVFDEVVTGFRVHPGGMQAVFGVKADIATYGKVLGGGLPIGIITGDARFLDALDGGTWRYGDDSVPEVGVTFFAGTFVRHPLALAAANAVLERLRQSGPDLQRGLNLRASQLVARLNAIAGEMEAPVRLKHFASWFMFDLPADAPLSSLFFAYMRYHGVHIWEGRPGFLTLMHADADLDRICEAFRKTLQAMQQADFLPRSDEAPPVAGARVGRDAAGNKAWFVPDPNRPGKFLQLKDRRVANV
jgi:acyl transferase domain-containing protein/glutamate-1-semialdehyde aminotransferase